MLLGLEEVEQPEADRAAQTDGSSPEDRQARAHKRRINREALPAHLPRAEIVVEIDDKTCPCCRGELHGIGEDRSERWTSSRRSLGCWSPGGPNMAAGATARPKFTPDRASIWTGRRW